MRIVRFFLGVLLIPVCVVVTQTVISLISVAQPASDSLIPLSALAFGMGFFLWILVFCTLPHATRSYVLAHELTHALWGALMGASVSGIKVSKEKGSVRLSKTNVFITLAPYFFPLYTMIVVLGYVVVSIFYDTQRYYLVWLGLVGWTWGFHVVFTVSALMHQQTDIKEYGSLFSYTVIYIFNMLGIAVWIVAVSAATFEQMVGFMFAHLAGVAVLSWKAAKYVLALTRKKTG
jgi:hypothetical protein